MGMEEGYARVCVIIFVTQQKQKIGIMKDE